MENQALEAKEPNSENFNFEKKEKDVTDEEILLANSAQSFKNDPETPWEAELEDLKVDFLIMSKQDYLNLCSQIHENLQSLLTEEMTDLYANFSLLFKKFRLTYIHNMKLLRKIFELESEKRILENNEKVLLEKLEKSDEREKDLRDLYEAIRNAMAETVEEKNDIIKERDELKEKLLQIPEEVIKSAGEYSLTTATVENNRLKTQLLQMNDEKYFMEEDIIHSKKREEMFRNKYYEAKAICTALQEEIVAIKRDVMLQAQMKENAQSLVLDKKAKIKANFATIKELKEDIIKLQQEVKHEKDLHRRIYKEMVTYKISIHDSERTIKQMKNEFSARQFHATVLNLRKKKLEEEVQKKLSEIHSLKVEIAKISKEKNAFGKNIQSLSDDIKRLETDLETECRKNSILAKEISDLQKGKHDIENENATIKKEMRKICNQLRSLKKEVKQLEVKAAVQQQNKEAALKELDMKSRQLGDLENLLARNREEKDNLIREVTEFKSAIAEWQELTKSLKQQCDGYDAKILQLNEELQDKNYQYKNLKDMHREMVNQYYCVKQELKQKENLNTLIIQRIETQTAQMNCLQEQKVKMDKQITHLKMDIKKARSSQTHQENLCKELSEKLNFVEKEKSVVIKNMFEKEMQLNSLTKELNNLDNERKMLKYQVEEKNNEIKLKEEKIKLMQQDLAKVEKMLQDRVSDIKLLKNEVESLRRSEEILKSQNQNHEILRTELNSLHRQFLVEKLKSKTIEEELQKPQNIHRWRILEAEDPTRAHLITRNLKFQKDLVKVTERLKMKEQELHDKNHQIEKLEQDLKKYADSKLEGNAWIYKKELQECKERMKCLKAEVIMYENLTNKQQIEYKELKNEVNRLKLSAYTKKKSFSVKDSE